MMMKFRDIQVAEEIGRKAELGWFDMEFTMYGCAYLENGCMYYKVSPEAGDIYQFIEQCNLRDIYPSNVISFTETCPVPAGMKELIAQEVKKDLARKLRTLFPQAFLSFLQELAQRVTTDSASDLLWQEAEALEGQFEEEKLSRFEELVNYSYSCRKISSLTYQNLLRWLAEERKSMRDDFVSKDILEKTLYGIVYENGAQYTYLENAQSSYIYAQLHTLEQQGVLVSPVFAKTYWYNYVYRLPDVKRDFKALLRHDLNEAYLDKLRQIRTNTAPVDTAALQAQRASVQQQYGAQAAETLTRYLHRWNIV